MNPLVWMTSWNLGLIDVTWCWVSSLVMICQVCCIRLHFLFVLKCSSIGFRSGDRLDRCRAFHFFFALESFGLLLECPSGHFPSAEWSSIHWVLKHLAKCGQIIYLCVLQSSSCCLCHVISVYTSELVYSKCTLEINSRPFLCLLVSEIRRE